MKSVEELENTGGEMCEAGQNVGKCSALNFCGQIIDRYLDQNDRSSIGILHNFEKPTQRYGSEGRWALQGERIQLWQAKLLAQGLVFQSSVASDPGVVFPAARRI